MSAKFALAVGVLLLAVVGVAAGAAVFLANTHQQASKLFNDHLRTTEETADLGNALDAVDEAALLRAQTQPAATEVRLDTQLDTTLIPRVLQTLTTVRALDADNRQETSKLDQIRSGFERYLQLRRIDPNIPSGTRAPGSAGAAPSAETTAALFDRVTAIASGLRVDEARLAARNKLDADRSYRSAQLLLGVGVATSLLLAVFVALLLSRNVVPRIRRYAAFAGQLAAGQPTVPLATAGGDELAELGKALNAMVAQRELLQRQEQGQAEFVDTLQVTATEEEAHELLQRHLQRSLPGADAAVLQRNNSANRLQAATALPAGGDLPARLLGAEPRACLALRFARTHREGAALVPLLNCAVCTGRGGPSTCEPLLVGGEVIGSVLVSHPTPLTADQGARIKTSVAQAAPVLANLRNLALAEFRANNDSLTGLPNKRATDDTLKRMVAQAGRSITPLTAIMLDLDHFKQINDRFGHGKGDEVLAAVGAAMQACLRANDFAGRFGGEEFLVLLPDTGLEGAQQVAEKIRTTVESITISGVDRAITISLGIADLLEHSGNATGLLREADRALYAAKATGRNRTVIAGADTSDAPPTPATRPRAYSPQPDPRP